MKKSNKISNKVWSSRISDSKKVTRESDKWKDIVISKDTRK